MSVQIFTPTQLSVVTEVVSVEKIYFVQVLKNTAWYTIKTKQLCTLKDALDVVTRETICAKSIIPDTYRIILQTTRNLITTDVQAAALATPAITSRVGYLTQLTSDKR